MGTDKDHETERKAEELRANYGIRTFIVTPKQGLPFEVEGDHVEVDGLGTRILTSAGRIVYHTPHNVEVRQK